LPASRITSNCGRRPDALLTRAPVWRDLLAAVADWSAWLAEGDEPEELAVLRRNVDKGLPCGSETFIDRLKPSPTGPCASRPIGRPRKSEENDDRQNKG
jgi:hypothetical protein